jgi:hypothetical protein
MDNKKEYIQISKEDFEKIYQTVEILTDGLDVQYHTLKYVYYLLVEIEMKLDGVLNKNLMEKLDMAISYIEDVKYDLEAYYKEQAKPSIKILKNIKKEQINKNNG